LLLEFNDDARPPRLLPGCDRRIVKISNDFAVLIKGESLARRKALVPVGAKTFRWNGLPTCSTDFCWISASVARRNEWQKRPPEKAFAVNPLVHLADQPIGAAG
jgi:hypothetical protein